MLRINNMINFKTKKKLNSGLMSTAYLLDGKFIQLVGKRDDAYETYKDMKDNSDLLNGKITCIDYPHNMTLIEKDTYYPYGSLIYPIVKGSPLKADNLSKSEIDNLAKKLVEFNSQMHNANIHWDREWAINHEMEKVDRNIDILKDYLTKDEIASLKEFSKHFSSYLNSKKNFCITHGDLWADNLIVDENNNLTGIIDFGNMAYFLPEVDYASLWNMCDGLLDRMIELSNEDITKKSVNLFIMHRELCSFEYVLHSEQEDVPCQLNKIRQANALLNKQTNYELEK